MAHQGGSPEYRGRLLNLEDKGIGQQMPIQDGFPNIPVEEVWGGLYSLDDRTAVMCAVPHTY